MIFIILQNVLPSLLIYGSANGQVWLKCYQYLRGGIGHTY